MKNAYPIGTRFTPIGKNRAEHTVVDIHRTFNSRGELVKLFYVSTHLFCGQQVTAYEIPATTIARGNPILPTPKL